LEEVDVEKIGLVGFSRGGYLASRATAFEHRAKALKLINGRMLKWLQNVIS